MTINCKGQLIDLSSPKVMGILNITPDSFYDGNKFNDEKSILLQTEKMLSEGATFIDVGAYSSRPGATHISEAEELQRILPIIDLLLKHFPSSLLSIDTFRSSIAKQCIAHGAALINDISAGQLDNEMMSTIGKLSVPYIVMHMIGTPQNMEQNIHYEDMIKEIIYYFSKKINEARSHQVNDIIIDPGFGFSKTLEQNYKLLNQLELLKLIDLPLLIGISRKSMIYKLLKNSPQEALNGTSSLNTIALLKGASILRVHDVKEAMECIALTSQLH
ncbi:dihydropteroate synthase [Flavobacteriaceae bacterium AU392]|nr:dihydropteroate synthase [Flavobacteriaceae bacterium]RKM81271.1 dihydropteroate synthase [Flavobacteriaceae bacterium AU392]